TGTRGTVTFDEPQMAVAPGQGAAFYELDESVSAGTDLSLGGGWIESAARTESSPESLEVAR
ncbi:MAG: tRNA U34 2-thiouridine synthase MnmA/TrmU, partial [Planctomycetota bacterium]